MALIKNHDARQMRKAGKRDGRLWRWTLKPFFVTAKTPLPKNEDEAPPRIGEVGEAAQKVIAAVLKEWHVADGECQQRAMSAVGKIKQYVGEGGETAQQKYATLMGGARSEYDVARLDRANAWEIACATALGIEKEYAELSTAYVWANQAARRDPEFRIKIPALVIPEDFHDAGYMPLEQKLGLSADDLSRYGLQPERLPVAAAGQ